MKQEWEYALQERYPDTAQNKEAEILDAFGKNGWELVAVTKTRFYFKREDQRNGK